MTRDARVPAASCRSSSRRSSPAPRCGSPATRCIGDLQRVGPAPDAVGHARRGRAAGFISGTLVFAFLSISDRYSPRACSSSVRCSVRRRTCGHVYFAGGGLNALLGSRFLTGFFLAGIYPVGMRIAAGWYQRDLGHAIGLLVGALVLGHRVPTSLEGGRASLALGRDHDRRLRHRGGGRRADAVARPRRPVHHEGRAIRSANRSR